MPARSGMMAAAVLAASSAAAATALPLSRMPLDAARYCNRACPAASCSAVCLKADDCASSCTRRGQPVCRCRHGRLT